MFSLIEWYLPVIDKIYIKPIIYNYFNIIVFYSH